MIAIPGKAFYYRHKTGSMGFYGGLGYIFFRFLPLNFFINYLLLYIFYYLLFFATVDNGILLAAKFQIKTYIYYLHMICFKKFIFYFFDELTH